MLTEKAIKGAKPRTSVYRLRDGHSGIKGFGVTIAPAGSKTFFLSYTSPVGGKRTQLNLGRYPDVSLADARDKAREVRKGLSRGLDPKEEAKQRRAEAAKLSERPSVTQLFDAYIGDLQADGKKSAKEVRRIFDKEVGPVIGIKIACEVTAEDILDTLAPIVRRDARVHADNVRAYLHAAFEFGRNAKVSPRWRGRIPDFNIVLNPVSTIKKQYKSKPAGKRSLDWAEAALIWTAPFLSVQSRQALQLTLATGQRVEEVLHAPFSEFNLAEGTWTIPTERREKNKGQKEPHVVPITAFHLRLIEEIRESSHSEHWLFPSQSGDKPRHRDGLWQATQRFCVANQITNFAPRDLRRTWKTLAGSLGLSAEIRKRIQGHAFSDVASVHYDLWDYWPEKSAAMQRWTDALGERIRALGGKDLNDT